jgi:hypothetical protein
MFENLPLWKEILEVLGRLWSGIKALPRRPNALLAVPKQTMVILPSVASGAEGYWWRAEEHRGNPAMELVGDLQVANISKYPIRVSGAVFNKPALNVVRIEILIAQAETDEFRSGTLIAPETVGEMTLSFTVCPAVHNPGDSIKADISIIDQFNNPHRLKNVILKYRGGDYRYHRA